MRSRHILEQALREAISDDSLRLEFQPIVTARSRRCQSLEALLRWTHPRHGAIAPSEFIPIAERTGDIVSIGRWVLTQACAAAAGWPGRRPPRVSVNVSIAQILGGGLIEDVNSALDDARLDARRLQLEVTESLFAGDNAIVIPTLFALRKMGVGISLDDFGTGFSSIGTLRSLPIDVIKIDKSFVRDMEGESGPIIKAIRSVCRALDIALVAEGVETATSSGAAPCAQRSFHAGLCFSRPLPAAAVDDWLVARGRRQRTRHRPRRRRIPHGLTFSGVLRRSRRNPSLGRDGCIAIKLQ